MMLTAAVRDIAKQYPEFHISVDTTCSALWLNNPYIKPLDNGSYERIKAGYPLIAESNSCGLHFINGFLFDLNAKLKINAKLTEFKPDFHFTEKELTTRIDIPGLEKDEPYWLITSGGKPDFSAKWWSHVKWQEVVDAFRGKIKFVQVGHLGHNHPPLNGAINMVGKTAWFRHAMQLALHSSGICTIVTCFMHMAAGLNKPCVVVAGGREPYTWEAYDDYTREINMRNADPNWVPTNGFVAHKFLHTIGALPCCQKQACWRSKVAGKSVSLCKDIVVRPGHPLQPKCMDIIESSHVIDAINSYLTKEV